MISWSPVQLKPAWLTGVPSLGPDSDNSWVVRKSIHIIAPYRDFHAHFSERLSALKSIVDDMTGFLYLLVFIALHKRQDLKQDLWFASFQDASFEACHLAQRSVLSRIKWHLLCCLFPKHVSRPYQGLGSVSVYCAWGIRCLAFLVSLVFVRTSLYLRTREGDGATLILKSYIVDWLLLWKDTNLRTLVHCFCVLALLGMFLATCKHLPNRSFPLGRKATATSSQGISWRPGAGYVQITGNDMLCFFRCSAPGGGFGHVDLCCWTTSDEKRGYVHWPIDPTWPNLIWDAQRMLQICRSVTWWLCLLCSSS